MLDRVYGTIENAAQLPGQPGGQTLVGDSDGSGNLVLSGPTRVILEGDVGIGTDSPAVKLDVKRGVALEAVMRLQSTAGSGYSGVEYLDEASAVALFFGVDNAANTTRLNSLTGHPITVLVNSVEAMRIDFSTTADDTRLVLYDVTTGTMKRVSRGASDSGGVGFRVLRIPN